MIDGYLIDHRPPRRITTALAVSRHQLPEQAKRSKSSIPRTGQIDLFHTLDDQVDFEVPEFNKKVYTVNSIGRLAEAIAREVPARPPGKTLLFAARDDHADILVDQLRKALEAEYGPQPHDLVQKITGTVDKPARSHPCRSQRPPAEICCHRRSADHGGRYPRHLQPGLRPPRQQPHPL